MSNYIKVVENDDALSVRCSIRGKQIYFIGASSVVLKPKKLFVIQNNIFIAKKSGLENRRFCGRNGCQMQCVQIDFKFLK